MTEEIECGIIAVRRDDKIKYRCIQVVSNSKKYEGTANRVQTSRLETRNHNATQTLIMTSQWKKGAPREEK